MKLGRAVGNIVCSYEVIISKNAALMCDSGAHEQRVDGCIVVCHTAEVTVLCKKKKKKNELMASHGRIVLSYHDTLLRESDVELLDEPHWVNDNIIWFWMQYLENELYASRCASLAFVGPDVVQLVKLGAALNVDQVLKSLELKQKELILLPVNDCQEFDLPGGCHWSLLVYNQARKIFEHYDSSKGHNHSHAKAIARALAPLLSLREVRVVESDCLQQHNSFDCGLYVMYNLQQACAEHFVLPEAEGSRKTLLTSWMQQNRKTLKELIMKLSEPCV